MTLHLETLAFAAFVVAFALTLSMTALEIFLRGQPGLRRWVQSLWLAMFGAFIFSLRGAVPDFISVLLGSTMFVLSAALTWIGMREFCSRPTHVRRVLLLVILYLLFHSLFFFVWPSRWMRSINFNFMTIFCDLAIIWTLQRHRPSNLAHSARLVSLFVLIETLYHALILTYRILYFPTQEMPPDYFLESTNYLEGILIGICKIMGFIILLSHKLLAELEQMARSDHLTGILNRRALDMEAGKTLEFCRRQRLPCALVMTDLDHFKKLNDTHGHVIGDEALRQFTRLLQGELRKSDIFGRYGGEEFCILMPGTNPAQAKSVALRLKDLVEHSPLTTAKGAVSLTTSIGIAMYEGEGTADYLSLVKLADQRLYQAKIQGRNRVETGPSSM